MQALPGDPDPDMNEKNAGVTESKGEFEMAEFTCIPLTEKNILSFDDYIPPEMQYLILSEGTDGFGALEGDLASGALMLRRNAGEEGRDLYQLLWLYVDDQVRQRGAGTLLLQQALGFAKEEEGGAVYCRYPANPFPEADAFFAAAGFRVFEDEETEGFHIAWMELTEDEETTEYEVLSGMQGNTYLLPRLNAIVQSLADLGYEEAAITEDETLGLSVTVPRGEGKVAITIGLLPAAADPEEEGTEEMTHAFDGREDYQIMLKSPQPFYAVLPQESGFAEEAFQQFFREAVEEIDAKAVDTEE